MKTEDKFNLFISKLGFVGTYTFTVKNQKIINTDFGKVTHCIGKSATKFFDFLDDNFPDNYKVEKI